MTETLGLTVDFTSASLKAVAFPVQLTMQLRQNDNIIPAVVQLRHAMTFSLNKSNSKRFERIHPVNFQLEHIGRLVRMSVFDTEVDGSNPGSSRLFP